MDKSDLKGQSSKHTASGGKIWKGRKNDYLVLSCEGQEKKERKLQLQARELQNLGRFKLFPLSKKTKMC